MKKLIIALLCIIATDCYSFDFSNYGLWFKSDTSDYAGTNIVKKNNDEYFIISSAGKPSSASMAAMDAGVLVSYYRTESNGDLFYNKSVEIYNTKDFHFFSYIYSKAFINRDNEIVLLASMAKGKYGIGYYPKIIKLDQDLNIIYEFVDTTSAYKMKTTGQLPPIELLPDEGFITAVNYTSTDDSLQHITFSTFDRNGIFQRNKEIYSTVGDTNIHDLYYNGISYDPSIIKVNNNSLLFFLNKKNLDSSSTTYKHNTCIKTDLDGNLLWINDMFPNFSNKHSYTNSYVMTNSDSIIIFGNKSLNYGESMTGKQGAYIRILNQDDGKEVNYKEYGNNYFTQIYHCIKLADGNYFAVGSERPAKVTMNNNSNYCIYKFDKNFDIVWYYKSQSYFTDSLNDCFYNIASYKDNKYIAIGNVGKQFFGEVFTDNTAGIGFEGENGLNYNVYKSNESIICKFSPNSLSNISIEICNLSGDQIYSKDLGVLDIGEHTIELPTNNYINGVYFVTITNQNKSFTKKIII